MSEQLGLLGIPAPAPMLAVSVRQPWAWLILRPDITGEALRRALAAEGHFKDIENRGWSTPHVGRLYIHAAAPVGEQEYLEAARYAAERGIEELPPAEEMERGGLVGRVRLTSCVRTSSSRWFEGPWGWVLREPVAMELMPCAAAAGVFDAEPLLRAARDRT